MGMWEALLIGLIVLLLFVMLTAGAVVAAVWYSRRGQGVSGVREPRMPPPDALETLRRRYARGEITREQYLEIRQDLMHDRV